MVTRTQCTSCGHTSVRAEEFQDLMVPVFGCRTLLDRCVPSRAYSRPLCAPHVAEVPPLVDT